MEQSQLVIEGHEILPGQRKTVMLSMPKLYDATPLSMPVHIISGKKPGPVLTVVSTIHGDEVNGVEIIRRLLKRKIFKNLEGTLIAIPIVNVYGFLYQDRYLMDRRDLNRSFPGSKKGSLAARLAYLISTEIINQSTHIIDLHAGSLHRTNLPQIRANLDRKEACRLAQAFNAPVALHAALRDGSMREYANDKSIPFLLYEAGEALRFDELSIKTGVNGIIRVMQALKMIELKKPMAESIATLAHSSYWVRAPQSGILCSSKGLGKKIEKGEVIAKIANPSLLEEMDLKSPLSGIIIGKSNLPMAHEGAALFHVACFEKIELVEEQIENLQEEYSDKLYYSDFS